MHIAYLGGSVTDGKRDDLNEDKYQDAKKYENEAQLYNFIKNRAH